MRTLDRVELASEINEVHQFVIRYRDAALQNARLAVDKVIECGLLLIKAKEQFKGEYLLWLECNVSFSYDTARNYMNCALKYAEGLRNGSLDFQSVKQLYIAAGIMPPNGQGTTSNGDSDSFIHFWNFTKKIENWLPKMADKDRPRLKEWWTGIGKQCGWI